MQKAATRFRIKILVQCVSGRHTGERIRDQVQEICAPFWSKMHRVVADQAKNMKKAIALAADNEEDPITARIYELMMQQSAEDKVLIYLNSFYIYTTTQTFCNIL